MAQSDATPTIPTGDAQFSAGAGDGSQGGDPGLGFVLPPSDGRDNGPMTATVVWSLYAVALVFLSLRIYAKFSRARGLWWDDHALIGAFAGLTVYLGMVTHMITLGYGKHVVDVPPENGLTLLRLGNVAAPFSVIAVAWSKTSFALTLLRVSDGWVRWLLWFVMISMNVALGMTSLLHWIPCQPFIKIWDPAVPGTCWDQNILVRYDYFSGAYSAAMDFLLAMLPWYLLKDLQMKKKEKIGVVVCMSLGVFAGATAIVKCCYLWTLGDFNFTFTGMYLIMWGTAESAVTITAASIPILRVFLREVRSHLTGYHRSRAANTVDRGFGVSGLRTRRTGNDTLVMAEDKSLSMHGSLPRDDDSDKSILGVAGGKIIHTQEVNVEFHTRRDSEGYEMHAR